MNARTTLSRVERLRHGFYFIGQRGGLLLAVTILAAVPSVGNGAVTFQLDPIADAHVRNGSSFVNVNYGTNTVLEARTHGTASNNRDSYFKFGLGALTNITSAKLRIFAKLDQAASIGATVYSVTNTNWKEKSVTWNTKPSFVTALRTNVVSGTSGGWYEFDVTDHVQSQNAAGRSVVSFGLHVSTNENQLISINSRENSTNRPGLIIVGTEGPASCGIAFHNVDTRKSLATGFSETFQSEINFPLSNGFMVVDISLWSLNDRAVTNVTFGGAKMTLLAQTNYNDNGEAFTSLWGLATSNKPAGTYDVVISYNGTDTSAGRELAAAARSYNGVNQTNATGTAAKAVDGVGSSGGSVVVASAPGELVVDCVSWSATDLTNGLNQTLRWKITDEDDPPAWEEDGAGSEQAGAATVTMSWGFTAGTHTWALVAVPLKPADNVAPVPNAATLANVTGQCSATITNPPTATDNCAGIVIGTTSDPLTYSTQGTFTVHWTFADGVGNSSTTNQTVIVQDTTPPAVPTIPNATGAAPVTVTAPTTTDNCAGSVTGTTADPLTYNAPGTFTVHWTFSDGNGNSSTTNQTVIVNGTLPVLVPPPLDRTVATTLGAATAFLYTGTNAVQTGVASGTIEPQRAAVVRGRVLKPDASVLPGTLITVLDHPEFGQTLTRADGMFDLAVNGGGPLVIAISKNGYLPVQRQAQVPWQEFTVLPDVIMMALDSLVTTIDLSGGTQVARGNPVMDADGSRQATVLFPAGNTATMRLPDGTEQPLTMLSVRATEYTVGTNGPAAMPALLPPSSGYTYCVELTADEALAAGATNLIFAQPVYSYVENFLGFPVGSAVPVGYYDRAQGRWIPSTNGLVIAILSITGGLADLDVAGSGTPADSAALAALGITTAEQGQLAALYGPGQSLWRTPITHFTPLDGNYANEKPPDAVTPSNPPPKVEEPVKDPCKKYLSIIELQNQTLGEAVGVAGTAVTALSAGSPPTPWASP